MSHPLPICAGTCGTPVRPKGVPLSEHPDSLVAMAWGMCHACYAKKPRVYKSDTAKDCKGCERPFRPRHTRVSDYPGTVSKYMDGRCKSCHNIHHGVTKKQLDRRPERCLHCERLLRPKLRSVHEFPGTVEHAGKGMCTTCKTDVTRGKLPHPRTLEVTVSTPTPRVEFQEPTDPGLIRMRQAREARAEATRRQEQMRRVRIAQEAARARFIQSRRAA